MKNIRFINKSDIAEITIRDKKEYERFSYCDKIVLKKCFRKKILIENCYYDKHYPYAYEKAYLTEEEILNVSENNEKIYIIHNNIVYIKPKVFIQFYNRDQPDFVKIFDNIELAINWVNNFITENELDYKLIKLQ